MSSRVDYKRPLTSLLHRRFRDAFIISIAICYTAAIIISGSFSWFWSWFPIGPAGIRTAFLLIPAICVLTLRIALVRPDFRLATTPYNRFKAILSRRETLKIPIYYVLSAVSFQYIFIWCSPSNEVYALTQSPNLYARPQLNERRVYLSFVTIALALIQSGRHLYYDYDALDVAGSDSASSSDMSALVRSAALLSVLLDVSASTWRTAHRLYISIGLSTLLIPIFYSLFFSTILYRIYFRILNLGLSLHDPANYSEEYDFDYRNSFFGYTSLWIDALWMSSLLLSIWDFISLAFTASFRRPPLRASRLLSATSADPLTCLLEGLRSPNPLARQLASKELQVLSVYDQTRRIQIYSDLDRQPQGAWIAIASHCLGRISNVEQRVRNRSMTVSTQSTQSQPPGQPQIHTLPRISAPPRSDMNPFTNNDPGVGGPTELLENFAKKHGNSPTRATPARAASRLKGTITESRLYPKDMLQQMPGQIKEQLDKAWSTAAEGDSKTSTLLAQVRKWAELAQHTFFYGNASQYASAIVVGEEGDAAETINCIGALAKLAIHSVQEDQYGVVAKDIGTIIGRYTSCLEALESFEAAVESQFGRQKLVAESPAVGRVRSALDEGLDEMIHTFEGVTGLVGLDRAQLRKAKEAVNKSS